MRATAWLSTHREKYYSDCSDWLRLDPTMPVDTEELISRLRSSKATVVLTGAGVSAASGIPTFRGEDGLWRQFRAEDLATPEAFAMNPQLVWEWYDWRRAAIQAA